jgi:LDH2 family malate/lactate/ureidoglycolate dehydrogenase
MHESEAPIVIGRNELTSYTTAVFEAVGLSRKHARIVAENLVLADLRGIESHGVTRIPIYADRLRRGVVNRAAEPRAVMSGVSIVLVDGDNGPGAVVGHFAIQRAIEAARQSGVGIALARNSNHFGICADYALCAAEAGFIAMVSTNSAISMAAWGAAEPALGTNPFAFAAPVKGRGPVVLDFASSVVARGKIVERAKRGELIPEGWALDREGRPTTDAKEAEAGTVLPFSGPKGSGIGLMVEILCGALTGAAIGSEISNLYKDFVNPQNIGHFFLVFDPARALGANAFEERTATLASTIKSLRLAQEFQEILLPGEPEERLEAIRRTKGIPLLPSTVSDLSEFSQPLGVPFPATLQLSVDQ